MHPRKGKAGPAKRESGLVFSCVNMCPVFIGWSVRRWDIVAKDDRELVCKVSAAGVALAWPVEEGKMVGQLEQTFPRELALV